VSALADLHQTVPWYYASFSALDRYFRQTEQPVEHVAVHGDLISLAKALPNLDFPGVPYADAAMWDDTTRVYFRCIDDPSKPEPQPFRMQNILYDPRGDRYLDPYDDYRSLRGDVLEATGEPYDPLRRLMDAAVAVSRYPHALAEDAVPGVPRFAPLSAEAQRTLLSSILTGQYPWKGLALLRDHGFVAEYWPELASMAGTEQSKDHHPEGDVWTHSLETFRYRRSRDLVLTLGLLLHDSGKPQAKRAGGNRFDRHAEIGAGLATKLLRRLEFPNETVESVRWLVHKHMFPGALHALPTFRTERLMADPLFPLLLELYRCDLESSYRGPSAYYRACKIYRAYIRNSNNPYRTSEGKKLVKLYVD
jgi:poly(A) polymerase